MIARIEGTLEDVVDGVAEVRVAEGIVYELLVPACDAGELLARQGRTVAFHTLHYLESQGYIAPEKLQKARIARRDYSEGDLDRIRGIWRYYQRGISIARAYELVAREPATWAYVLLPVPTRSWQAALEPEKAALLQRLKAALGESAVSALVFEVG